MNDSNNMNNTICDICNKSFRHDAYMKHINGITKCNIALLKRHNEKLSKELKNNKTALRLKQEQDDEVDKMLTRQLELYAKKDLTKPERNKLKKERNEFFRNK